MKIETHAWPVIDVQGLSKRFTLHLQGGRRLDVLENVSLQVHAGECVALVGASGRGKSTLLKCLYGNYRCEDGGRAGARVAVRVDGSASRYLDLARATPQEVLALRRSTISYVSQFLRAVPRVPALDVVAERLLEGLVLGDAADVDDPRYDEHMENARARAAALLERLRVPRALWALAPSTFSGGEQQRVNIARGFVKPTPVLLLDEPTASLDAANREVVVDLIRQARERGAAIVGIFHDEDVRDRVATRTLTL